MVKSKVVVVFRKSKRKNSKLLMKVFENLHVDEILDGNKRKPPIPHDQFIEHIGIGETFIKKFKEKYNLELLN